ncbi:MAG TPA: HAD family hydrolase [Polyangiaceae bacterium]|nr:HAD family hydrolase [Polyangiaceae bacterium]
MAEPLREPLLVPQPSPPVELVCFDLGGVLIRIAHHFDEGCAQAGLVLRPLPKDHATVAARRRLTELLGTGQIQEHEWAERVSSLLKGLYSSEEILRIHHAFSRGEYDGASALIREIHERGVTTACLSNTNHAHWRRLVHEEAPPSRVEPTRPLPPVPEFPCVLALQHRHASHLFGVAKPDPRIYEMFESASAKRGPQILFFDDLIENVEAARARGWRAERIDPRAETVPQMRRLLAQYGVF